MINLLANTQHEEEEEIFETVCGCENPYCIKIVNEAWDSDTEKDSPKIALDCLTCSYNLDQEIDPLVG